MRRNLGLFDRYLRLLFSAALLYSGLVLCSGSHLELKLTAIALLTALTSIGGICPLYQLFGITTYNRRYS